MRTHVPYGMRLQFSVCSMKAQDVEHVVICGTTAPDGMDNGEREFSLCQILAVAFGVCQLL